MLNTQKGGMEEKGGYGKSNNEQKMLVDRDQSALSHSPSSCHCCLANVLAALNTKALLSAINIKCYFGDF